MINPSLLRIYGVLLIATAILGTAISIFGLFSTWQLRSSLENSLLGSLELAEQSLTTTEEGLTAAGDSLGATHDSFSGLEETVRATGHSLEDTVPLIDSLATLARVDLPNTITSTQTSLASAQESAEIIDRVLTSLTKVPLIGSQIFNYNPDVPLHESLGQVSESLKGLPVALLTMEKSLETARDNVVVIQADISMMASDLKSMQDGLNDTEQVIGEYRILVEDLQSRVSAARENIPLQLNRAAWLATLFLIWLGFSQVGFILQGADLLARARRMTDEARQP